eukprot:2207246-Rhodomonas_salina.3
MSGAGVVDRFSRYTRMPMSYIIITACVTRTLYAMSRRTPWHASTHARETDGLTREEIVAIVDPYDYKALVSADALPKPMPDTEIIRPSTFPY